MTTEHQEPFECWAILEIMGHRRLAGYVQEVSIASGSFLRIDIYKSAENNLASDAYTTQYYAASSIFALTPTTEATARQLSNAHNYQPMSPWEMRPTLPSRSEEYDREF